MMMEFSSGAERSGGGAMIVVMGVINGGDGDGDRQQLNAAT